MPVKKSSKWILGGALALMVILAAEVFLIITPAHCGHVVIDPKLEEMRKAYAPGDYKMACPTKENTLPNAVAPLPNGSAVVGGWVVRPKDQKDSGWLIGVDKKGHKVWEKDLGKRVSSVNDVKRLSNGNVIVLGTKQSKPVMHCPQSPPASGWWMAEITPQGKILRETTQATDASRVPFSFTLLADGYAVAGTILVENCTQKAYLAKLDRRGKVIWEKHIQKKDQLNLFHSVARLAIGNILAIGNRFKPGWVLYHQSQDWLMLFAPNGEIVWEKRLPDLVSVSRSAIAPIPDGDFVSAGSYDVPNGTKPQIGWIGKYTPEGNQVWHTKIPQPNSEYSRTTDVVALPIGAFLITGSSASRKEGLTRAWLAACDHQGNITSQTLQVAKYLAFVLCMDFVPPDYPIIAGICKDRRGEPASPFWVRTELPLSLLKK